MRITALLRQRNESLVLQDTLDHLATFADDIIMFDDASTDNCVEIAGNHPNVSKVIRNNFWNPDQQYTQTLQRKYLLEYAKAYSQNEWVVYVDADERLDFDWSKLDELDEQGIVGVRFKLFDAYLTTDDKEPYEGGSLWDSRKYFGPEFRLITFAFKKSAAKYPPDVPGIREPTLDGKQIVDGYVQHYGKGISVDHWEETCKYYIKSMPQLADKWERRQGKAIHDGKSDFGAQLVTWDDIPKNEIAL